LACPVYNLQKIPGATILTGLRARFRALYRSGLKRTSRERIITKGKTQ